MEKRFFDRIKNNLQNRWIEENFIGNVINNKKDSTHIGNRIGMDYTKFGFTVWDWNDQFLKSLKKEKFSNPSLNYDTLTFNFLKSKFVGIPFQYIEQVPTWQKGANWTDVEGIMGNWTSHSVYANSTAQDLSITLMYYAESSANSGLDDTSKTSRDTWTLNKIERIKKQLQSLVFPQYDGKFSPPVKVLLNIGNMFVDVPVVIKSISIEDGPPYEIRTMRAMLKKITLEMRTSYPTWQAASATKIWTADDGSIFGRQEFQTVR